MNRKEKIEQEINKTINQFENKETLAPNPYFFTRIQQQLEQKPQNQNKVSVLLKPAALVILIILNLSTVFWYLNSSQQSSVSQTKLELIDILEADLNWNTNYNSISIIE